MHGNARVDLPMSSVNSNLTMPDDVISNRLIRGREYILRIFHFRWDSYAYLMCFQIGFCVNGAKMARSTGIKIGNATAVFIGYMYYEYDQNVAKIRCSHVHVDPYALKYSNMRYKFATCVINCLFSRTAGFIFISFEGIPTTTVLCSFPPACQLVFDDVRVMVI